MTGDPFDFARWYASQPTIIDDDPAPVGRSWRAPVLLWTHPDAAELARAPLSGDWVSGDALADLHSR